MQTNDRETLWEDAVSVQPDAYFIVDGEGNVIAQEGTIVPSFSPENKEKFLVKYKLALHTHKVVSLSFEEKGRFFEADIAEMPREEHLLSVHVEETTNRILQHKRLVDLSYLDPLTGLYNRRMLDLMTVTHVAEPLQKGRTVAALVFDIDHFKIINDTYGHQVGDVMLRHVAGWIRKGFPEEKIVRFGGDEFTLFPTGLSDREIGARVKIVMDGLRDSLYRIEGLEIHATISVGCAISSPCSTYHDLVRLSDKALYQAKKQGRNQLVILKDDSDDNRS